MSPENYHTSTDVCPKGYYCDSGGVKSDCAGGTYGGDMGLTDSFCSGTWGGGLLLPQRGGY